MFCYFTLAGDTEQQQMQLTAMRVVSDCLILTEWKHAHDPVDAALMQEAGFTILERRKYCILLSKLEDFTITEDDD